LPAARSARATAHADQRPAAQPFIVTLGSMSIITGLSLVLTGELTAARYSSLQLDRLEAGSAAFRFR
jgi:ribose/xylose/arabinose/galactoside ABC-type transport system permease subunit